MNGSNFEQVNITSSHLKALLRDAFLTNQRLNNLTESIVEEDRLDEWQLWIFGLLIVTGFSFAAPIGILLVPLLRKSLYDRFMTFLVALGIGSMSGSCLFILIPQAFNITELKSFDYTPKSWLLICSIYGFFVIDRVFQFGIEFRRVSSCVVRKSELSGYPFFKGNRWRADGSGRKKLKRKIHLAVLDEIIANRGNNSFNLGNRPRNPSNETQSTNVDKQNLQDEIEIAALRNSFVRSLSQRKRVAIVRPEGLTIVRSEPIDSIKCQLEDGNMIEISPDRLDADRLNSPEKKPSFIKISRSNSRKCSKIETEESSLSSREDDRKISYTVDIVETNVITNAKTEVASVVYMILFGCSANNFVDGMSIGAAFSDGLVQGVSIGLAVFTQQLPEGLGTLAILVNSGLGIKKTLTYNFIPIALSYMGFVAGLFLDNLDDSYDDLIFSISAGMYFYIFLGTLIPEIRDSVNEQLKTDIWEATLSTVLQVSGIALGVFFMFFMSSFSSEQADK